jgi:hypothetical protein
VSLRLLITTSGFWPVILSRFKSANSLIELGNLQSSGVAFHELRQFSRLAHRKFTARNSLSYRRHGRCGITGIAQCWQLQLHRAFSARWQYAVEADTQRGDVALLGQLDGLPSQRVCFAVEEYLGSQRRSIASAWRLAGRIAAFSWSEPSARAAPSLLCSCIFSHGPLLQFILP